MLGASPSSRLLPPWACFEMTATFMRCRFRTFQILVSEILLNVPNSQNFILGTKIFCIALLDSVLVLPVGLGTVVLLESQGGGCWANCLADAFPSMHFWLPCKRLRITETRNHSTAQKQFIGTFASLLLDIMYYDLCPMTGNRAGKQSPSIWQKIHAAWVAAIHHLMHRCCVSSLTQKAHSRRIIPVSFLSFPLFLLTAVDTF